MNLTPASLKTLRRKGFKKAMKYLSQSSSPLCVFASLRLCVRPHPPFPLHVKKQFPISLTPASRKTPRRKGFKGEK